MFPDHSSSRRSVATPSEELAAAAAPRLSPPLKLDPPGAGKSKDTDREKEVLLDRQVTRNVDLVREKTPEKSVIHANEKTLETTGKTYNKSHHIDYSGKGDNSINRSGTTTLIDNRASRETTPDVSPAGDAVVREREITPVYDQKSEDKNYTCSLKGANREVKEEAKDLNLNASACNKVEPSKVVSVSELGENCQSVNSEVKGKLNVSIAKSYLRYYCYSIV